MPESNAVTRATSALACVIALALALAAAASAAPAATCGITVVSSWGRSVVGGAATGALDVAAAGDPACAPDCAVAASCPAITAAIWSRVIGPRR